jgi:tRNA A37 methylthiotransferase MiaB
LHKDYIDKKSKEFFGKKVNVLFTSGNRKEKPKAAKKDKIEPISEENEQNPDDFERIIKEKLGGKEISDY